MLKKFFAFVTLIVIFSFTLTCAAQNYYDDYYDENYDNYNESYNDDVAEDVPAVEEKSPSIVDTLRLLKPNEITALTEKIQRVEDNHQIRIGIEFLKNTHGQSIEETANSLLDKNFLGAPNGGILLLVVMDTRNWRISTDSAMRAKIPDSVTEKIANTFVSQLSEGNYYGACSSYIDGIDKYLTYYEMNGEPYDSVGEFDSSVFLVSIVVAIVLGGIFRSMLIGSMSNVKKAVSAGTYLQRDSVQITGKRDTFLFTNISRRRKSRGKERHSSHPSGGRGGGHGGSGGSF